MASRLPILLLLCLIPILASALGEEEKSHEVDVSSAELQASVVKREAKDCKGKGCNKKKGKARKGRKGNPSKKKTDKGKKKGKRGKKSKSRRRKQGQRKTKTKTNKKNNKNRNKEKKKENKKRNKNKNGNRKKGRKVEEKKKESRIEGRISGEGRQITGNATSCAMKAIKYARLFEGKATSIFRQVKRVKGNDKIQGSKGKKKGDFNATMERLVSALGGDIDNPKCDGQPIKDSNGSSAGNATFRNGTTAKSTIDTLKTCEKDIEEKCANAVTGNATKLAELEACFKVADDFKTSFEKCLDKKLSIDAQCKCVEEISDPEADLQKCNTKSDNDKALELKKACKQAVGTCKQAEAKAAEGIDSCKERTKCGGVKDPEEAKKQLKVLTPLKAALDNPAMSNALKATGLDKGPGADGQVPSSRFLASTRDKRQTDGAGCTSLGEAWDKFNTSATKTAMSAAGDLDEASATETTGILNDISGRSTLEDDLKSCATETRQGITVSVTIVRIRITLFWCLWWQVTVIEVKITIITVTFGVTTPSVATTPTTVVTRAPRDVGRKLMLQNLMKRAALTGNGATL